MLLLVFRYHQLGLQDVIPHMSARIKLSAFYRTKHLVTVMRITIDDTEFNYQQTQDKCE